ncbi:MAG: hypothetical protein ABSB84_12215 [Verrucomicrobiota bacterium]
MKQQFAFRVVVVINGLNFQTRLVCRSTIAVSAVAVEKFGGLDAKRGGDGLKSASGMTLQKQTGAAFADFQARLFVLVRRASAQVAIARWLWLKSRFGCQQIF